MISRYLVARTIVAFFAGCLRYLSCLSVSRNAKTPCVAMSIGAHEFAKRLRIEDVDQPAVGISKLVRCSGQGTKSAEFGRLR